MAMDFPPENLAEATAAELVPAVADISSRDKEIPGDKLSRVGRQGDGDGVATLQKFLDDSCCVNE